MTVSPTVEVLVRFDVDVAGVSATSFTVVTTSTGEPVQGNVTYDPAQRSAVFRSLEGLPGNEQLTVALTAEISDPVSARSLMPYTFMFRTSQDTIAPVVVFTMPSTGTTGVSVATDVVFRFSEKVMGVSSTTLTMIETASTTVVPGTVTYDSATRTATFDPQDQLTPNLSYTARLTTGIADLGGNALAPVSTTFMTGADAVAPAVRVTAPQNGDTNVARTANIVVTFDEPVANVTTASFQINGGGVAGAVTMSNGNRTATFDPAADLPAAAIITVTLSTAITDTSGNALLASTFSFTTI
jgi:hypothetical protein